eukprot:gnl/TRDRNA2_/TRDRNA2_125531_c0_seq1.p1 gnl/TRDRNA2_/TRDRNA2_125531_c0~~gnl/TRDRNA2_/TRDRNA2_125531_c0_seq1.p1  ORF type:complete len:283 (-),score=29.66 gnl/TRDRNA2_/TRDRNA2_125531_c0_seq1:10-858(-)
MDWRLWWATVAILETSGHSDPPMLRVIGAGYPHTGTEVLSAALTKLGYRVADERFPISSETNRNLWLDWVRGGDLQPALSLLLGHGLDATIGEPFCWAYEELLQRFPTAKVILTVHPGGSGAWLQSISRTFSCRDCKHRFFQFFYETKARFADCALNKTLTPESHTRCRKAYKNHNEAVKRIVPPDKLLEFDATKGWEPLCRFLGRPQPALPFPHSGLELRHDGTVKASVTQTLLWFFASLPLMMSIVADDGTKLLFASFVPLLACLLSRIDSETADSFEAA